MNTVSSLVLTSAVLLDVAFGHGRLIVPMTRVGHEGYENDPIGFQNRPMTNFACRHTKGSTTTSYTAGDVIDLKWVTTAAHVGDAAIYISYDDNEAHVENMEWFKIANIPDAKFFADDFYQIELPEWLPAGNAVLRWEWYALHVAPTAVELYVQCADIDITNPSPSAKTVAEIPKYHVVASDGTPLTQALNSGVTLTYRNAFDPASPQYVVGPECAMGYQDNDCDETNPGTTGWVDMFNGNTPTPPPTEPTTGTSAPTASPVVSPTPPPSDPTNGDCPARTAGWTCTDDKCCASGHSCVQNDAYWWSCHADGSLPATTASPPVDPSTPAAPPASCTGVPADEMTKCPAGWTCTQA